MTDPLQWLFIILLEDVHSTLCLFGVGLIAAGVADFILSNRKHKDA